MKKTTYNTKSREELVKLLGEAEEELRGLRFQDASGQLKNVRNIRTVRKTIAQIKTALASQPTE